MKVKNYRFNKRVKEYRKKAAELVGQMTLEEKVFQTLHSAPAIEHLDIKSYNWWNEALHGVARAGVATVFPQAIGLAASFDEELLAEVGEAVSTEGRAKFNFQQKFKDTDIYKGLTFWAPNVNIFRDPRWGRGHETLGEDPYLTSRLGTAFIEAMQGDGDYMKVAACAKHFAVHSGPESVRHSFNAEVTMQDLFETYLPAFQACVQEGGVEAVMGAYNRTNGEPCCGSPFLLQDILRQEWGFEGHVTSDCWAIKDFHEHHQVTAGAVESVALAMNSGCDLNCGNIFIYLIQAVKEGLVKESRLDEAVANLLVTRMKLGLFEEPEQVPYRNLGLAELDSDKHKQLNRRVSGKTLVLLKNEQGLLPLDKHKISSIGVIGPNADNRKALVGNYEGTASEYVTIVEGIREQLNDGTRLFYSEGCHLYKERVSGLGQRNDRISEVRAICEASDVLVACMGLDSGLEGEDGDEGNEFASGDKPDINLPGIQEEVLKIMKESGKPMILVILSGSALALDWADRNVDAIVQGWYPGAQGGRAIADLLFGESSPEGKLPVTFYSSSNRLPEFTDYAMKNRTYRYLEETPVYPFGYGLTYTDIRVTGLTADTAGLDGTTSVTFTVLAENNGSRPGTETIQLYFAGPCPNAPRFTLRGMKKVSLQPGEKKEVAFCLKAADFGLYNENAELVLYQGDYRVYAGISQPDERSVSLTGKRPRQLTLACGAGQVLYYPEILQKRSRL